jgi:polyhydroxyalkanoate synthesis regulator phasin
MSHQLNDKIREVLAKMTILQSELGHLETGVALLQRQLESLKAGEKTIH